MKKLIIAAVAVALAGCSGMDTGEQWLAQISRVEYTTLSCEDLHEAYILAADEDLDAIKDAAIEKQCDTSQRS